MGKKEMVSVVRVALRLDNIALLIVLSHVTQKSHVCVFDCLPPTIDKERE